jgi:hypothetical protein
MSIASLYPSINPSLLLDFANSKVLDPRITFTRTTTATYYDGVTTAKAEENLVTYSQEFDNAAWTKTNVTVTANSVAAPDGTTTADTVTQSAGTNYKLIYQAITGSAGQSYAVSVYAKAGTNNYIQLLFGGSNTDFANFDLSGAGAVGTVSGFTSGTTATITSVGNSWFRCVVSWSSLGVDFTAVDVCLIPSSTSARAATTADTNTVYLWGMQMEQRSSATAYTATTTQAITNYIPVLQTASAGQARFDHNPTTGESLGLLIEEARTNSLTYSAQFDNAAWTAQGCTVGVNVNIAPDGTLTADSLVASNGTNSYSGAYRSGVSGTNCISFYVKAGNKNFAAILTGSGSANNNAWFNLGTGVVGTKGSNITSSAIESVGNGWYRISIVYTYLSGNIGVYFSDADNSFTCTGNGFTVSGYVWGAQQELGSFVTSYIPTVASTVTRNADAASMTGTNFSSWFNNGEGTVYWDRRRTNTSASPEISIYNSTVASAFYNGSIAYIGTASNGTIRGDSVANGVTQASVTTGTGLTGTGSVKTAYAYKANDFAGSSNGQSVGTDTSGILQTGVDTLAFFTSGLNGFQHLGKFAYYPIRVTNAQLQSLTV